MPAPAEPRTVEAAPLEPGERVSVDGRLDEAVWQRAVPAQDFVQVEPANGMLSTERTEVRIAFGPNALYMGVTCFDSDPDGWLGYQRRRDETLGADDRFMWTIDTFLDARSGYFFETNPSGLVADSLMGVNGDNRAWDGIYDIEVRRSDVGWTIEVEIPFRTLNFDPSSETWGINFQRTVRRKNEEMIWMGWARNQGLRRMTNAGRVTGLRSITQGHGLDLKPYGLVTSEASPGRGNRVTNTDPSAGLDVFYNPTPGVRANLTINTDFAQTEVDQRQVNLTRYSLFFPEKRDFFLDGAIFFDFASPRGGGNNNFGGGGGGLLVDPFFTRRVGLSDAGTPQKINYGTKLTGQVAGQDVGVLHVRTGEDDGQPGEDFTAARFKHRMLRQSYIGAIYTRRDSTLGDAATRHTSGLDFRLATSQFRGSQNLELSGWLIHATRPDARSGNSAYGATLNYPNDRWEARVDVQEVQENFQPAVGFVTRTNYRRYAPSVEFGPRPRNNRIVRQYNFGAESDIQTTLDNELLARTTEFTLFGVNFQTQDNFFVEMSANKERLDEPFAISRNPLITLPLGAEYSFTRLEIRGQTANRRKVALNGRFETGQFYSGTRTERQANITLRVRPGLIFYFNSEFNTIDLAEGAFSTRLFRFTPEIQLSPWMALVNNVQYDTVSRVAGWQSRFRWILQPGTDLYIVYNHNWLDDAVLSRFSTLDRRFSSKVLYTHRF